MSDSAPRPPVISVESSSVAHRWPGLGRGLYLLTLASFLGPLFLLGLTDAIGELTSASLVDRATDAAAKALALGCLVAPALGAFSAIATSVSIPLAAPASLSASAKGLRILRRGTSREVPAERIVDGLVLPSFPSPAIELRLRGGRTITAAVASESEADALLDALGIGAARRRVTVSLGSANSSLVAGCVAFPLSVVLWMLPVLILAFGPIGREWVPALWCAGVTLTTMAVARSFRPAEVVIGTDGLRVRRPWSSRWIPYEALTHACVIGDALTLRFRVEGDSVDVMSVKFTKIDQAWALEQRIREAAALRARGEERHAGAELLDRAGRSLEEWREALAGLVGGQGYRRTSLTAEDLIGVLEDPRTAPGRRIGAAVALRASGHPEARARIRIAADACGSDPVREALESAAEDELDEPKLKRALG
jgi:hypothetical protein